MKKILLFSIVFVVAGASANAQKKISKETAVCQKKSAIAAKKSESGKEKATVPKNPKQLSLQKSTAQPANAPAELKDERAN